jgi:hypothetical protein
MGAIRWGMLYKRSVEDTEVPTCGSQCMGVSLLVCWQNHSEVLVSACRKDSDRRAIATPMKLSGSLRAQERLTTCRV